MPTSAQGRIELGLNEIVVEAGDQAVDAEVCDKSAKPERQTKVRTLGRNPRPRQRR